MIPRLLVPACILLGIAAGCNQPVSQDRKITVSPDGKQVAIQHDGDGVFVTDPKTGKPQKVFQPGSDVLATSPPQWHADGKRVIFAVAKTPDGSPAPRVTTPADGRRYAARPCVYSCMMIEDAANKDAKPVELFTAPCDRVGFVGGDLAVRWAPGGDAIDFIQRTAPGKHSLFRHDLKTKTAKRVLDAEADALVFDLVPGSDRRYCLLGTNGDGENAADGLWFEQPDGTWRQAPETRVRPAFGKEALESLRQARPSFSRDGGKAAMVLFTRGKDDKEGTSTLCIVSVADRRAESWLTAAGPLHDVHWRPDGSHVGLIRGEGAGELLLFGPAGKAAPLAAGSRVVNFAGWDAAGTRHAYVRQDDLPCQDGSKFSLLLLPNPNARTSVVVADGKGPARVLNSGLRATFLLWYPNGPKLTLWLTFEPTYRRFGSMFSEMGAGLMPGDPAATLDAVSGKLDWKTVNDFENVQVGHHHLILGELDEARRVYESARPHLSPRERRELLVFEWLLLKREGKPVEARAKLDEFRTRTVPMVGAADALSLPQPAPALGFVGGGPTETLLARNSASTLERDLFIAEVCLSVGAVDDAADFFRSSLETETGHAALSSAIILANLELLRLRHDAYGELVFQHIVPALAAQPAVPTFDSGHAGRMMLIVLYPMSRAEYLAAAPEASRKGFVAGWRKARLGAAKSTELIADSALFFLAESLKDEALRKESAKNLGLDTPEKEKQFREGAQLLFQYIAEAGKLK